MKRGTFRIEIFSCEADVFSVETLLMTDNSPLGSSSKSECHCFTLRGRKIVKRSARVNEKLTYTSNAKCTLPLSHKLGLASDLIHQTSKFLEFGSCISFPSQGRTLRTRVLFSRQHFYWSRFRLSTQLCHHSRLRSIHCMLKLYQ